MKRLAAALMILLAGNGAEAAWVGGHGERLFGPDLSESDACKAAEEKAKEDALRKVTGERVSSEDLMACSDKASGGDFACTLNRFTWSQIDGDLRDVRPFTPQVRAAEGGARMCVVDLEADVQVDGSNDPSFDLSARLNRNLFRPGESLELALAPTQAMHVAVFQWLPYEKGDRQVSRLFPNAYDRDTQANGPVTIPSAKAGNRYALRLAFPEAMPKERRLVDEYLMVVGTRRPVAFKEQFALDEFKARLMEIPAADRRIVKRGYAIARPE